MSGKELCGAADQMSPEEAEEYFEISAERGEPLYWIQASKKGFEISKKYLSKAYEEENPKENEEVALEYLEEFAAPALRLSRSIEGYKPPSIERWAERAQKEISSDKWVSTGQQIFNISLQDILIDEIYLKAQELPKDRFDYLVGVYSSGIPPLYMASSHLEGEEIILRYSHMKEDDSEVLATPRMEVRPEFKDASALIIDDLKSTGETLREVGKYLYDRGAKEVRSLVAENVSISNEGVYNAVKQKENGEVKLEKISAGEERMR